MHRQQEACLFLDCQLCFCTHLRYLFYGFRFTTNTIWNKQVDSQKAAVPWKQRDMEIKNLKDLRQGRWSQKHPFWISFANSSGSLNSLKVAPGTNGPILTLPSYQVMPIFFESAWASFCHMVSICNFFENHGVSGLAFVAVLLMWRVEKVYKSYIAVLYIIFIYAQPPISRLCR